MAPLRRSIALLLLLASACGSSSSGEPQGGNGGSGGAGGSAPGGSGGAPGGSGGASQAGNGGGAGTGGGGLPVGTDGGASLSDADVPPDDPITGTPTFVAAGYGGLRAVSRDLGRTWVDLVEDAPAGGDDSTLLRGIGCGAGLCIAGGGSSGPSGRLLVTDNGRTWMPYSTGAPGISDVAYGRKLWVAVSGNYAVRSTDGRSWAMSDKGTLADDRILRKLRFAGSHFIAWGDKMKCVVSDDGVVWVPCVRTDVWNDLAYGNGIYVAVGSKRMTSTDGLNWQSGDAAPGDWIVWTGSQFVVGGAKKVQFSADGRTWTEKPSPTLPQPDAAVAYGAGTFVANWAWSSDGVTWTKATPPNTRNGVNKIAFGGLAGK